jgi:L,D-transpeptidase ErfK/SrfK
MRYAIAVPAACALLALSARAAVYDLPPPGEDLVGAPSSIESKKGDTLASISLDNAVGFRQVLHANPQIDPWNVPPHTRIVLPTSMLLPQQPREGIVINIPEMRLYYYPKNEEKVYVYPVAVGRVDWRTPLGTTTVVGKVRNPVWYPTEDIRAEHAAQGDPLPPAVPPGPDNPLGTLALKLGWKLVLIHGTNAALAGIGMPVTHGCIRLYPQDIDDLFNRVPVGTKVTVLDQPFKMGHHDSYWYVEAHAEVTENAFVPAVPDVTPTLTKLKRKTHSSTLDWDLVAAALKRLDGLPTPAQPLPASIAPPARPALKPVVNGRITRASYPVARTQNGADPAAGTGAVTLQQKLLLFTLGLLVVLSLLLTVGVVVRRRGVRVRRGVGFHRSDFRL